jgi:YD repeat-containing protein
MGSLLDLALSATVTDPLSHTTMFRYDAKGNLTTITVNSQGQPFTGGDKRGRESFLDTEESLPVKGMVCRVVHVLLRVRLPTMC